jgi:hypothetical protein
VHHSGTGSLGYCTRGSDSDGAVDNRHLGLKKLDVTGSLSDKVLDLKRVADMQNIDLADWFGGGRDIYPDDLVVPREEFKERPPYLSESDDNDLIVFPHCLASLEKCSSS